VTQVRNPNHRAITPERIEAALDKLAIAMVRLGPEGARALPIYERLERELEALRVTETKMARVRERARVASFSNKQRGINGRK